MKSMQEIKEWLWPYKKKITLMPCNERIRQHVEVSKIIRNTSLTLLGFSIFCFIALFEPDAKLLSADAKISVPFTTREVSYVGFIVLGPTILIVLTLYLHIYVKMWKDLGGRDVICSIPYLINLDFPPTRILLIIWFYFLAPSILVLFTWKALPRPGLTPSILIIVTFISIFAMIWMLISYSSVSNKAWVKLTYVLFLGFSLIFIGRELLARRESGKMEYYNEQYPVGRYTGYRLLLTRPMKLSNQDFRGKNLENVNLAWSDLSGSILKGTLLRGAILWHADLRNADLQGAQLDLKEHRTILGSANLAGANLTDADMLFADLSNSILIGATVIGTDLTNADLNNANLTRAILNKDTMLEGAVLCGSTMLKADLRGAIFLDADLTGADLSEAKIDDADFDNAKLLMVKGIDCQKLSLAKNWKSSYRDFNLLCNAPNPSNCRSINSILNGADLRNTNFHAAKWKFVQLENANLEGTDLSNSDLAYSNLKGANMLDTNLYKANLEFADLRGVRGLSCDRLQKGNNWEKTCRDMGLTCDSSIPRMEISNGEDCWKLAFTDNNK